METLDVLLSSQFSAFSELVSKVAAKKKARTAEFKTLYEAFQEEMKALDQSVLKMQQDFEEWKKERDLNVGDG
jgi:peptidoglycan hydrolase CwlO-like protein